MYGKHVRKEDCEMPICEWWMRLRDWFRVVSIDCAWFQVVEIGLNDETDYEWKSFIQICLTLWWNNDFKKINYLLIQLFDNVWD